MATESPTANSMASMVCVPCKRRKKGCDKKLPICSRCERLNAVCCYPTDTSNTNSNHPAFSISTVTLDRDSPGKSSNWSQSSDDVSLHLLGGLIDLIKPSQAEQDFTQYFTIYHINLPIVNKEHFMWKLTKQSQEPHFILLKLAVSMVAQLTSQQPEAPHRGKQIYARLKAIYSHYQTCTSSSVDLLLAGLLIASHEYCQDFLHQSWLTVGACAKMGQIILLEDHGDVSEHGYPIWWWGVIILERIVSSDFMGNRLPATSDSPQLSDLLPTMSVMDVPGRYVSHELYLANEIDEHGNFVTAPANFTSLNPFSATIQATYLNDLVTDHLFRGGDVSESRRIQTARLTSILEKHEEVLTPPPGEAVGHYCGAYGLQTCALFRLHENELLHAERTGDTEQVSRSRDFLKSKARTITVSLRYIGSGIPADIVTIALWSHKIVYHVAMAHIRYGVRDEEWASDLDICKRYLKYLSETMKLHGRYLREIEDEELRTVKLSSNSADSSPDTAPF